MQSKIKGSMHNISIMHQNIQSIGNAVDQLEEVIKSLETKQDLTALCLAEHWNDKDQIKNYEIKGFQLPSCFCRSTNRHGGSAIYVKQGTTYHIRNDLIRMSIEEIIEISAIDLKIGKSLITVLSVYTTPGNSKHFLEKFRKS